MTNQIQLDFCTIDIYDNFMIVVMNAGVNISLQHNGILVDVAHTYFKNERFVYITHRVNSYSVDPAIYKETSKITNLAGFCVVSKNFMAKSTAEIEKLFLKKPFEIFDSIEEATAWAKSLTE